MKPGETYFEFASDGAILVNSLMSMSPDLTGGDSIALVGRDYIGARPVSVQRAGSARSARYVFTSRNLHQDRDGFDRPRG